MKASLKQLEVKSCCSKLNLHLFLKVQELIRHYFGNNRNLIYIASHYNMILFSSMNSDLSMSTFYNNSGCNNDAPLSSDSLLGDLIDMDTLTK